MESSSMVTEVYHYCNLNRFLSIVKNQELWLVDLCKSNDGLERELIFNLFALYLRMKRSDDKEGLFDEHYLKMIEDTEILKLLFEQNDYSCGICFSTEKDLLSQWRGYANDGKGVSIGFNTNIFRDSSHSAQQNVEICKWKFGKIEYDQKEQLGVIDRIISKYSFDKDMKEHRYNSILLAEDLWQESMFFKHYSFSEEHEYRFVVNDSKFNSDDFSKSITLDNCVIYPREWFARDNNIVSYRKLNFSKCDNPILSVTIGPKSNASIEDIMFFLQDMGLNTENIEIKKSASSYR